jgi:hypothetical protein
LAIPGGLIGEAAEEEKMFHLHLIPSFLPHFSFVIFIILCYRHFSNFVFCLRVVTPSVVISKDMPLRERNSEKYKPFHILRYFNVLSEVRILWEQNIAKEYTRNNFYNYSRRRSINKFYRMMRRGHVSDTGRNYVLCECKKHTSGFLLYSYF